MNSRKNHHKTRHPGYLQHEPSNKWASFLANEESTAKQRLRDKTEQVITFRGLELLVPSEQLRPRAASGPIVDAALAALGGKRCDVQILDLGVGCGALLLSILHTLGEGSSGTGVDLDEAAVQVCQTNALRVLPPQHAERVHVVLGDFGKLDSAPIRQQLSQSGYDIIVCNPPYRSLAQQAAYDRSCGQFGGHSEDVKTLVAGETGLEAYEAVSTCLARDAIAAGAHCGNETNCEALLRKDGTLIFQVEAGSHGKLGGQAERVGRAIEHASKGQLTCSSIHIDESGLERAIVLKRADTMC